MTKKDYIVIAETIKSALVNEAGDYATLFGLASQFCGRFLAGNSRFDSGKFMRACGLTNN